MVPSNLGVGKPRENPPISGRRGIQKAAASTKSGTSAVHSLYCVKRRMAKFRSCHCRAKSWRLVVSLKQAQTLAKNDSNQTRKGYPQKARTQNKQQSQSGRVTRHANIMQRISSHRTCLETNPRNHAAALRLSARTSLDTSVQSTSC